MIGIIAVNMEQIWNKNMMQPQLGLSEEKQQYANKEKQKRKALCYSCLK